MSGSLVFEQTLVAEVLNMIDAYQVTLQIPLVDEELVWIERVLLFKLLDPALHDKALQNDLPETA